MKKIYNVKFNNGLKTIIVANNRREVKEIVESMVKTMNATEWFFELA